MLYYMRYNGIVKLAKPIISSMRKPASMASWLIDILLIRFSSKKFLGSAKIASLFLPKINKKPK